MVAKLGSVRWEREVEVRLDFPLGGGARLGCSAQPHPGGANAPGSLRDEQPPPLQGLGPAAPLTRPVCCLWVQNRMYAQV